MTHLRKLTAVLLAVIMVFALAACGQKDTDTAVDKDLTVNVVALNGTTGFGMAKLMSDSKAGTTALSYNFTVETDPSNATAALVNGTADIAAQPTTAAAAPHPIRLCGNRQAILLRIIRAAERADGLDQRVHAHIVQRAARQNRIKRAGRKRNRNSDTQP